MSEYPQTKAEAEKFKYNQWAGNPGGTRFNPSRCAYEVQSGWLYVQCSKAPVAGPENLYCKQHAKKVKP